MREGTKQGKAEKAKAKMKGGLTKNGTRNGIS